MKQIEAIIERASDGTYSVYCKDEIFSGAGDTIEAAKADMAQQMAFYKETAMEEGFKYPEWLDGDYTVSYTFDTLSAPQAPGYPCELCRNVHLEGESAASTVIRWIAILSGTR